MALESEGPGSTPSPQLVGNVFVEQYYHVLHRSPESVYKFYQDTSVLSRPDTSGTMTSVTTMQGINEKILSIDYKDYKIEIKTADAQKSYQDGVIVLVTGCLTNKDASRRKFTQTFFLAPQQYGYFVANDIFQFTEEIEALKSNPLNEVHDPSAIALMPNPEQTHTSDTTGQGSSISRVEDNKKDDAKVDDIVVKEGKSGGNAAVVVEACSTAIDNVTSAVPKFTSVNEDTPKKSYASILNDKSKIVNSPGVKGSPGSGRTKVYVPTSTAKVASVNLEKQSSASVAPSVPEVSGTRESSPSESQQLHEEVVNHSIYVRNLPFDVTVAEVEGAFKKFGPIKQGGIQVISQKDLGHCFGFVEFLSSVSMTDAIQASRVNVGDRQAVVEIKKTTSRGGGGRGRFYSGRGGFRFDNFRGRGNFGTGGGDRGYVRNEYSNRGALSGRGRGLAGRGGDGYQQGRGGRYNRQNGPPIHNFSN